MNMTLFAQIVGLLPREDFDKLVGQHNSNKHSKGLDSWHQLIAMVFCQFTKCEGLRDICNGLMSAQGNLNHLGISHLVKRSTLSYQNTHRSWELFRDFYLKCKERLFEQGNRKDRRKLSRIKAKIFMLDASLIGVCLKVFDWAHYRQCKGAMKLHMLLDYDNCRPQYMYFTDGRKHEAPAARQFSMPKGSVVVADRGFLDFKLLQHWHEQGLNFVVRCRDDVSLETIASCSKTKMPIMKDAKINLSPNSRKVYQRPLRLVEIWDEVNQKIIRLLTNQKTWTAQTISELYKQRWSIEIFFRDIKTHLKVKTFIGTSPNAVLIQLWTAMLAMLILKYLKIKAKYNWSLANLISFIRIAILSKIDLFKWLNQPFIPEGFTCPDASQQLSFNFIREIPQESG
ncbi:MAG: IS4 family transposase [Reichenbachiella sp.]|uniref:IS4 family transposase n=1 Tax=Reichenbachiella sp. TaxID=2184521 RepID=UPI0029662BF8|nr:IS4 family transposase [Reichenbachiella sp.]MDW3209506.1 IS4 family transposase [Reichenbachiella sp.]